MTQQEALKELKENTQQAKQLNEVIKIVNEAIKAEMPVFMKLVQFDAMKEIHKKAAQDKEHGDASTEGTLTAQLDTILKQINEDLKKQIIGKSESLK